MFLIEFDKGKFIDAERIDYINLNDNEIIFTLAGDTQSLYRVEKSYESLFCNNLQAINGNINIDSVYLKLKKDNS